MNKIIAILFLTIPVTSFAASFDCNKASTVVEKAICSDSELSSLDENLSALYKELLIDHPELKSEQIQWIRETRQCESATEVVNCVKTSYENRIEHLKTISADNLQLEADQELQQKEENETPSNLATQDKPIVENIQNEPQNISQEVNSEGAEVKITESTILIFLILIGLLIYFFKKRKSTKSENIETTSSANNTIKTVTKNLDEEIESTFNKGVFLYEKGDFEKAFDLLQKTASAGHSASQFYLGKLLTRNAESEDSPSYAKGIEWFEKSAKNNYQPAVNELSLINQQKNTSHLNEDSLEEAADDASEFLDNNKLDGYYSAIGAVLGQLESQFEKQGLLKTALGNVDYECSIFCSKDDHLLKISIDVYSEEIKLISDEKAKVICDYVASKAKDLAEFDDNLKTQFDENVIVVFLLNDKPYQFNKPKSENKKSMQTKSEQFCEYLEELENNWMNNEEVRSYINDCGGSINAAHFVFEDTDEGYYLVCELEVNDIDSIPEDVEENILNNIEWAFDDVRDSLEEEGLDLDSYLGEKLKLKKVDSNSSNASPSNQATKASDAQDPVPAVTSDYIDSLNEIFEGIADKVMERGWMNEFVNTSDFNLSILIRDKSEMAGYTDVVVSFTDYSDEGSLSAENAYEIASWLYEKLVKGYRSEIDFDTFGYIHVFFNDKFIAKNIYDLEDFETSNLDSDKKNRSQELNNSDGSKTVHDDKEKSMFRYVRQNQDGEFLYGVVYSVGTDSNGNSLLRGAYYGYAGGGEYDGGYFLIDFEADTHNVLSFDEAESSEEFESLEPLMAECGNFYENDDESYELSDYAKSLLANGVQDDDDVIYMDEDFDGDALSEVSEQWAISLRFES